MKYSELDTKQMSDHDIYDLVMTGITDYAEQSPKPTTDPDMLIVLGCSPVPLRARVVKMVHLYQEGYGKYVLFSGGTGWHKLFQIGGKKYSSKQEKLEDMKQKAHKYKEMKKAIQETLPDEIYPDEANPRHGKSLYRYMHRKLKQTLGKTEAELGYRIMKASQTMTGIDDDKIFFETQSKNTIQNLEYSKQLLDDLQAEGKIEKLKRIMIITSCFHCRRAELSFQKYFPGIEVLSCPSTIDIEKAGLTFTKHDLMQNPYYSQQIRNELNAIVNYTRNGSISDLRVEDVLGAERAEEIRQKVILGQKEREDAFDR